MADPQLRAEQKFVLAIDGGSQSTKVHVIDGSGVLHATAQRPLRPSRYPAPGAVVHPDDDLWDSLRDACQQALAAFEGPVEDIVGVGLCTIRFCRALLRHDGTLAEPVLSWMDERVSRPYDGQSDDVAFVTTSSGYITNRLTGQRRDAGANYQGLWPIDHRRGQWSHDPALFEAAGMPRSMLFDLVEPGGLLGQITAVAAEATGIPAGLPVFATANDKAVEALGAGVNEHSVLLSLGTYIASMTPGSSPVSTNSAYWVNSGSMPGSYLYESNGIRRGMWTVSWARDLFLSDAAVRPDGRSAEDVLGDEAAGVPPGSGGVMALMDWLAPPDMTFRRGALLGFDGTQGRAHIYRAVLEGIALTMADNIEAMEKALGRTFEEIVVSGGGAKSNLMMQIVADVLRRPTRRTGLDGAAGLGSAVCAAVGAGLHPDWVRAVAAMVRSGQRFQPDHRSVEAYQPIRVAYRDLHSFTDPLFETLACAPVGA